MLPRIMKTHPIRFTAWKARAIREGKASQTRRRVKVGTVVQLDEERWWPVGKRGKPLTCPYGEIGDVHWIQEPWRPTQVLGRYELASKHPDPDYDYSRWRPAHTMPWLASEQSIRTLSIYVARIQDITEEEAVLEGVPNREAFEKVWGSIHGPLSWRENEWVFVINFEKYDAHTAQNTKIEA